MPTQHYLDTQQIELLGRSILQSELIRNGFEVAEPIRDKGYDLIVYREPNFKALPIQMKASTGTAFGIFQKYEKFPGIVKAYVWNVLSQNPRVLIMGYDEAKQFVPDLNGKSWTQNKKYTWSTAPKKLEEKLRKYENRWEFLREKLRT